MKKITILFGLLISLTFSMQSQTISIIGDGVGGWADSNDVDMATTDNITYTLTNYTFVPGSIKFRQDNAWTINWGGTAFPMGTAVLNSSNNIPCIAGSYDVTFNLTTLAYDFVSTSSFADIGIIGSAINAGSTNDENMFTTDGVNYFLEAFDVTTGDAHFRQDDLETVNWSDAAFPAGTGTQDGTPISVSAGTYNINLDISSGAYSFDFVNISLIGQFNTWSGDTDLNTTDGENYTLDGFVLPDTAPDVNGLKFRQNHGWATSWGDGSGNIILTPDTYDVTFMRSTGTYTFTSTTASITDYSNLNTNIKIYPTITNISFKANTELTNIEIYSMTGKLIKSFNGQFNIGHSFNVSELNSAIYYVTLESTEGNNIQRLIVR